LTSSGVFYWKQTRDEITGNILEAGNLVASCSSYRKKKGCVCGKPQTSYRSFFLNIPIAIAAGKVPQPDLLSPHHSTIVYAHALTCEHICIQKSAQLDLMYCGQFRRGMRGEFNLGRGLERCFRPIQIQETGEAKERCYVNVGT
jgi:hypothetical protein